MRSRVRSALARLGARRARDLLLRADDLPGAGWQQEDQRSWRTGAVAAAERWQQAARATGSVTVRRSFADGARWLWVQCTPLACPVDGTEALLAASSSGARTPDPRADVRVVGRADLVPPPVVSGAERVTATQETTTGPGIVLTLRCLAGAHLVVLGASGAGWTWPALVAVAERQLGRLPAG
jgi:hypothetical protein